MTLSHWFILALVILNIIQWLKANTGFIPPVIEAREIVEMKNKSKDIDNYLKEFQDKSGELHDEFNEMGFVYVREFIKDQQELVEKLYNENQMNRDEKIIQMEKEISTLKSMVALARMNK